MIKFRGYKGFRFSAKLWSYKKAYVYNHRWELPQPVRKELKLICKRMKVYNKNYGVYTFKCNDMEIEVQVYEKNY